MSGTGLSPEEKLLSLIKGNRPGIQKKVRFSWNIKFPYGIKLILMCVIVMLFFLIGYEFRPEAKIKDRMEVFRGRGKTRKAVHIEPIVLKPYSYYADEIQGKSLFSPLVVERHPERVSRVKKIDIEEIARRYHLKGIILGGKPEAFIEDIRLRRTFTVTIGDSIGEFQVKDIKEGRVTLGYGEESYDLFF